MEAQPHQTADREARRLALVLALGEGARTSSPLSVFPLAPTCYLSQATSMSCVQVPSIFKSSKCGETWGLIDKRILVRVSCSIIAVGINGTSPINHQISCQKETGGRCQSLPQAQSAHTSLHAWSFTSAFKCECFGEACLFSFLPKFCFLHKRSRISVFVWFWQSFKWPFPVYNTRKKERRILNFTTIHPVRACPSALDYFAKKPHIF